MGGAAGVPIIRFCAPLTLTRATAGCGLARPVTPAEGGSPRVTWGMRHRGLPFTFLKRRDFFPGSALTQGTGMQPQR